MGEQIIGGDSIHQVSKGIAQIRHKPDRRAKVVTQLLFGEAFRVVSDVGDWHYGFWDEASVDGYVHHSELQSNFCDPSHRVNVDWTPILDEPDLEARVIDRLSLGSCVLVLDEQGDHYRVATDGWVFKKHFCRASELQPDYVSTAEQLIGVPFVWGGRSFFGMDCSGLIQFSLMLAGIPSRRRLPDLIRSLGERVDIDQERPQRGDFLFFNSHCSIFWDSEKIINSNGKAGRVQIESYEEFYDRMVNVRKYRLKGVRRLVNVPTLIGANA